MTAPVTGRPAPVRPWPARHPLVAFTGLAYALSWICWLPLLADRQGWVGWSASPYLHLLGGLGPAVAAIVVTGVVAGRAGVADVVARSVTRRGRLGWLAVAVLGPLALFAMAVFWVANLVFYGFVAVFRAAFDITITTPTTTTLIPTLMGAAITIAALAVIPVLARGTPVGGRRC